jgi:hypothetical protein
MLAAIEGRLPQLWWFGDFTIAGAILDFNPQLRLLLAPSGR